MAQIKGSNRIDILVGSGTEDRIEGLGGHDILFGLGGDDELHGGTGNDQIEGGAGADFLFGDEGNDILQGGEGNDRVDGGAGGQDMVVLTGRLSDYRFDQLADGMLRITDLRSGPFAEGVDLVANVEMFRFMADNRTVRLNDLVSNRAPVALNDTASVGEDGTVTIAVLVNDTDPDAGDARTIVSIDAAGMYGSATITPDGQIAYDPGQAFQSLGAGQTATDTFSYTMRDAAGATSTATVTVTVVGANDGPVAVADVATVGEDGSVTIDVLANDNDADVGDSRTIESLDASGALGTFSIAPNGTIAYSAGAPFQALGAGQSATDVVTYTMRDASGATSTSTISVTVMGANDAPVAVADAANVGEDGSLTFNVLANDSDPDAGANLSVVGLDLAGTLGQVTFAPDGTIDYDPGDAFQDLAAGDTATDTFTYTVRDAEGAISTVTVSVVVAGADEPDSQGPVAHDDMLAFASSQGAAIVSTLLGNDVGEGVSIASVAFESAAGARLSLQNDGSVIYDPADLFLEMAPGASVTDSFSYTIVDAEGVTSTATATITVTARDELMSYLFVQEDTSSGNLVDLILEAAAEAFGPGVTLEGIDTGLTVGMVDEALNEGVLIYNAMHAWLDPLSGDGYPAQTSLAYIVADANGVEHAGRILFTIHGSNDEPDAFGDFFAMTEGTATSNLYFEMLENDSDPDGGDSLSIVSVDTTGMIGSLAFDPATRSLVYTAADRDAYGDGNDTFTYTVRDDSGAESSATVYIDVHASGGASFTALAPQAFGEGETLNAGWDAFRSAEAIAVDFVV